MVESAIKGGESLLKRLAQAGFPVETALWFYYSDMDRWRLLIASQMVDAKGPKAAHARIQHEFRRRPQLTGVALADVQVISPKNELVRLLRSAISTGHGLSGIRFTGNAVNNVFIEDAYLYRVT